MNTIQNDLNDTAIGKNLKLAKRHKKIIPGKIKGDKTWKSQYSSPGTKGKVSLKFTNSGHISVGDKISIKLPSKWALPKSPNVTVKLSPSLLPFTVQSEWNVEINTLEFIINDNDIEPDTDIELILSGITTPECATAGQEAIMTIYENIIIRNTIPPTKRGGQIIDGPSVIDISKIIPGKLGGNLTWIARNFEPNYGGEVSLEFKTCGAIPKKGKVIVELPENSGWTMSHSPKATISCGDTIDTLSSWDQKQNTLELMLVDGIIPMNSNVAITIHEVRNPTEETNFAEGRITTIVENGGVIDGPSKIVISRISRLTQEEIDEATEKFNKYCVEGMNYILLESLQTVLNELSITFSSDQFENIVMNKITIKELAQTAESLNIEQSEEREKYIEYTDFINLFTNIYRPANKYGQQLRIGASRGNETCVRDLIGRGCNPHGKDGLGWTTLHYAAAYNQVGIINILFELFGEKLQVNAKDKAGWTSLMVASSNGYSDCVKSLINGGADIDAKNNQGRTALHWAASKGMDSVIKILILAGANKNCQDNLKFTPLHLASMHQNVESMKCLIDLGCNSSIEDKLGYKLNKYCDERNLSIIEGFIATSFKIKEKIEAS